ncbi:hypothetical protein KY346_00860 [Candidatus Woesearchaeota archaeon]|nr:hypothetical protein [Candidatus Woesearchaeota archaeon]
MEKLKKFPTTWVIGSIALAVLLAIFLIRKATITGNVATGGTASSLAISPISAGMITVVAVSALILIVIFAGIGKKEH